MPTISASGRSRYSLQVLPAGMLFSILSMLVTLLALTSGNNLLYLLVAVLLATGIFSLFASRLILSRIDVTLRHPAGVVTGEGAVFDLTVRNRRRFFPVISQSVTLIEDRPRSRKRQLSLLGYLPVLPGRTEAEFRIERRFKWRGVYRLNALRLETRFPFGILAHRRRIGIDGELIVYPAPRPLADFIDLLPLDFGLEESWQKGRGNDLYGIRQSLQTDHHQRIDWKATARAGQLMVREHARDDDRRVTIFLRTEGADGEVVLDEKYEAAIVLAASLADYLIGRGTAVRFIFSANRKDTVIPFATGQAQMLTILDLLARLPTSEGLLIFGRLHQTFLKWHRHRSRPPELNQSGFIREILNPDDGLTILIAPEATSSGATGSETGSVAGVHFISYNQIPEEFAEPGSVRKRSER